MKQLMLVSLVFFSGCNLLKLNSDALAKLEADVENVGAQVKGVEAQIGDVRAQMGDVNADLKDVRTDVDEVKVVGAEVSSKMTALETTWNTDVEQKIKQQIEEFKGSMNIGTFSGGAVYVMVVCLAMIAGLLVFSLHLMKNVMKWRGVWKGISEVIENVDKEEKKTGNHGTVSSIKQRFNDLMTVRDLKGTVDSDLKKRGLL